MLALGPGRVCAFLAPSGAVGLGHIGWAFRVDQQDDWIYGSTENPSGQNIQRGGYNGAWVRESNWQTMLTTFASDLLNTGNTQYPYYHHSGYYSEFRCKDTTESAVGSAHQTALNIQNRGYDLIGNDCLDDAIAVLNAYDSSLDLSDPRNASITGLPMDPNGAAESEFANATRNGAVPGDWFTTSLGYAGFDPAVTLATENVAADPTPSSSNAPQPSSSSSSDNSSQSSSSGQFCIFGVCF